MLLLKCEDISDKSESVSPVCLHYPDTAREGGRESERVSEDQVVYIPRG